MQLGFHDVPGVKASAYGEAMYRRGRALVEAGIDLSHLVWDADDVLWDWALSGVRLMGGLPAALFGRLGHREWIAVRPGMLELLWGMRHAALELGRDPHVRIWTSGYPWRLWRILREIEGFDQLLGPPYALAADDAAQMRDHPRVFTRPDYVAIVTDLLDREVRDKRLASLPEPARSIILAQLEKPDDSGFKIPELALLFGKQAFAEARFLIDDARRNVEWFKAAGRSAVHVKSRPPRIIFGKVRNSAWSPARFLMQAGHGLTSAIADALAALAEHAAPTIAVARSEDQADASEKRVFAIDVPNDVLWREWISPMRRLRKAMRLVTA